MSLTPASVFQSLDRVLRMELLARHKIDADDGDLAGEFSGLKKNDREALEQDLNCIATLGTDYAAQLVHDYLVEEGWTAAEFSGSRSTRDRACALLCQFPDTFHDALAIWNGNRLRGRLDREQGFRLPDVPGYSFVPLSEEACNALTETIRQVVSEHYPGKTVSRVKVFERTSLGLSTSSPKVLQCDISLADDPESIEVLENGEEKSITINRLSRISVIIDPGAGTLFVGTELGKKKLHEAIAGTLVDALFDMESAPEHLSPLRVYPERCKVPVKFSFSVTDGIDLVRISELRYRLFRAPSTLVFSARDEDPASQIHDLADVRRHAHRMRIWRVVVDFVFKGAGDHPPLRRSATLTEPSTVSFGRAFPEERVVMERVLTRSGLIDPTFNWDSRARFSDVARLIVPHHAAELRQSWLPLTVTALSDAGILIQGQPHARAWCRICGETHGVKTVTAELGPQYIVQCPVDPCPVTADHIDTLVLSIEGLSDWLGQNAVASAGIPRPVGEQSWLLGRANTGGKGKPFDLILAVDVDHPETSRDLNDYLLRQHTGRRGLVLTLGGDPIQKVFPNDWRAVPLHAVCDVTTTGLKYLRNRAEAAVRGRGSAKSQKGDEDWDEIFAFFETMFEGERSLRPYIAANEMIAANPELCDVGVRRLVDQLKSRFPLRFEGG